MGLLWSPKIDDLDVEKRHSGLPVRDRSRNSVLFVGENNVGHKIRRCDPAGETPADEIRPVRQLDAAVSVQPVNIEFPFFHTNLYPRLF